MGSYYVTECLEVLVRAGCQVEENEITDGWWSRSRSSGGFTDEPLGVVWHHTASSTSPNNDLDYMINGSPDKPIGNLLLGRDGIYRPIAAGGANTQGKGGPNQFSRGVCPLDQGNTKLWAIEIANNGVGEPWPQVQIDAAFKGSNALNAHWHNRPDDVVTHALGAGDGYTSRKIDPATAAAVQGAWRPASANTSGTWLLGDLRAECRRRSGQTPPQPTPTPPEEEPLMLKLVLKDVRNPNNEPTYICDSNTKTWVKDWDAYIQLEQRLSECDGGTKPSPWDGITYRLFEHAGADVIASYGPIVGPRPPGVDEYGR